MTDNGVEVELIVAIYPNTYAARVTLGDLVAMHGHGTIELVDAAVMVREISGELSISERAELTPGKGARRGALVGAVIGIVFPPSLLASAAIGAAAGAVTGKVTDQGFRNEMLREIAEQLQPGRSAIVAVVEHAWHGKMLDAIAGYDMILNRTLSADEAGSITLES
jgi:uncharacterized membrane protein